jgi:hypothetical protein
MSSFEDYLFTSFTHFLIGISICAIDLLEFLILTLYQMYSLQIFSSIQWIVSSLGWLFVFAESFGLM